MEGHAKENNEMKIGKSLSDYSVLSEIGKGSFGKVFLVKCLSDEQEYVLKKIEIRHLKQDRISQAMKEVDILQKVAHPNIIQYFTSFVEDQCLNIVMELARGGDLQTLIKKHKATATRFSEERIWSFAWDLCSATHYLHKNKIVHRDIKPLNILLTENQKIKVGDLGVSRIVSDATVLLGTRVGTPLYLAPELVKQQPYDMKVPLSLLLLFRIETTRWMSGLLAASSTTWFA